MHVDLVKTFRFEAAHRTPWEADDARLHGHSYEIELVVSGECDAELGWLIDYAVVAERFEGLYDALDHRTLNEVEGLADTSIDGLRDWLKTRLADRLDGLKEVYVSIVGEQIFAPKLLHADGIQGIPERIRFGFEAAHALPRLPETHKCRRMHGHSFVVEVGAKHMGTLTSRLQDVYSQLDHRCLNEVPGLENPTSEEVSRWIWNALAETTPDLTVVSVAETCTARCIYHGR